MLDFHRGSKDNEIRTKVRVLVTGCGARGVAVGTIDALRKSRAYDVEIVGVDAAPTAVGRFVADRFHVVPLASNSEYLTVMERIIRDECIEVMIPLLDVEIALLYRLEDRCPAILASPPLSVVELCTDKGQLLKQLYTRGLNSAPAFTPVDADDLNEAARILGYPDRALVVKPRRGSGSKGVWVVCEDFDKKEELTGRSAVRRCTLEEFRRRASGVFGEFVVMPFADGDHYTVSCLNTGDHVVIIPIRRDTFEPGITWSGEVVKHRGVIEQVDRVITELNMGPCVNVQLAMQDGRPMIYEINPRLSTTSTVCTAAGVNFADALLHSSQGKPYTPGAVCWGLQFSRYAADLIRMV